MQELAQILDAMRKRMPWPVAREILAERRVPVGHGWQKTLEKCKAFKMTAPELQALTNAFREHLLCGEKIVRYYALNNKDIKILKDYYSGARVPQSEFSAAYPLVLTDKKLKATTIAEPKITAIEELKDGIAVLFSSVKVIEEKTDLPVHSVKILNDLDTGFSKIIGIAYRRFQAFDVLWIPKRGNYISIRTDIIGNLGPSVQQAAQERISAIVQADTGVNLFEPFNLFPVIDKIYKSHGEGTVVELAFVTGTSSLKHEKMRLKTTCLRTEQYHKGGKAAVNGKITPFKIGIRWAPRKGNLATPELGIFGNFTMTMEAAPAVYDAQFTGCNGAKEFNAIDDRMKHYLAIK